MPKRKTKNNTLTKIDPSILAPKPVAISQHAAHDGTRVTTTVKPVRPPPDVPPADPFVFDADPSNFGGERFDDNDDNDDIDDIAKEYFSAQDNPLLHWRTGRDLFLGESIRLEGRGVPNNRCELCRNKGMYRCIDCLAVQLLCGDCMSRVHSFNPLHVIEKWNGSFFQASSLREAGHLLQLGHHPADSCTNPQRSTKTFTIVHVNGVHLVDLAYCGCSEAGDYGNRVQQLLRRRLFPATATNPQTACTFLLLMSAQLLSLQSKLSLYDYYLSIEQLTDATGTIGVNDRYKEFLRTLRMWRHIRMAKRGGRSYDPAGIDGTSPGELAVLCPACPIPSVNLPPDWQSVEEDLEYLYYQTFGIDACFRFKRRQISNYERDPELGPGYAYLVAWDSYSEYLRRFTNQDEMSTCSGLSALDHANTKYTKGYATSGIVCTTCRHEFILPEGAGPLQKGERYANVDYVVVRSTSHNLEMKKVASYDIMCQWSINLQERLKSFPLENAKRLDDQIVARLVPKFHLAAHKEDCRINFSLNYEPGVGRSDMEGPERTWFGLQGGGSTKDQGPGYWSDAMDDKFGHWNWSKLVRLGVLLAKKYTNALAQSAIHADEFAALCFDVPEEVLDSWTTRICSWEIDRNQPNPYFNPSSGPSELEIRRRLTLEEEWDELVSAEVDSTSDFTETKYLLYGLDLEEQQRKLQAALTSSTSSPLPTSVVELRTSFRRRLVKFRQLQAQYQPEVAPLLVRTPATDQDPNTIHDTPLFLPSSLPPETMSKCSERLVSMEKELRIGQCRDSLAQMRTKLTARARLLKHKYVNVRHQAPNTRSRNLLNRVNKKIETIAAKYRHAFGTLPALDRCGGSEWRSEFLELRKQDVRCLSQVELPDAPTQERAEELHARTLLNNNVAPEGNRTVSWIWRGSLKDGPNEYGEEFRLEWSKARAREARWSEEVALLKEEMRRVLEFLKWRSNEWLRKGEHQLISSLTTCPYQLEGLRAYACRQAGVFGNIHDHFLRIWKGLELPREYLSEPIYPVDSSLDAMELDGDDA